MERKVSISFLKIGMYVSKLDRPWLEAPFLMQGFYIMNDEDIEQLVECCEYVFIDTSQGVDADEYLDDVKALPTNKYLEDFLDSENRIFAMEDTKSTLQELPVAKVALEEATELVATIMEDGVANDKLNVAAVKSAVEPILDSMIRNSDAFMWLTKMRQHDVYSYDHAIENCALGIAFGRHMGLQKEGLSALAMGLLLMDVGKAKLSKELLHKKEALSPEEYDEMKKHVDYSVDILRSTEGIDEDVITVALTHHERYDGSGYPNGLTGVQIPVYGRMAAIIDCYDAMITTTEYRQGMPEHAALQKIYDARDQFFQQELVEQFLQCMGVYPTGSLVELSTGEVGVIMSQNMKQRLKPRVMLLLDDQKHQCKNRRIIDLSLQSEDANGMPLHISKGLDRGTYDVDVSGLVM